MKQWGENTLIGHQVATLPSLNLFQSIPNHYAAERFNVRNHSCRRRLRWRFVRVRLSPRAYHAKCCAALCSGFCVRGGCHRIVPDVMRRRMPLQTILGFALGVVAMLLLKALTEKKASVDPSEKGNSKSPVDSFGNRRPSRWAFNWCGLFSG